MKEFIEISIVPGIVEASRIFQNGADFLQERRQRLRSELSEGFAAQIEIRRGRNETNDLVGTPRCSERSYGAANQFLEDRRLRDQSTKT